VDNSGNAYVTGATRSSDFPTTPGAVQRSFGGGEDTFVVKIGSATPRAETRVVVAGSEASRAFAVIDFTTPATPHVVSVNPMFVAAGSHVTINGSNAVAGGVLAETQTGGGNVRLVDVSNPARPVLRGMITTALLGIGAIAMRGNNVAVGEQVGARVILIDFSLPMNPVIIATVATSLTAINSIAFTADRVVVAAGSNDFQIVQVDFSNASSPGISNFNPRLSGPPSIDGDADGNSFTAGDSNGPLLRLFEATSRALLGTANTRLANITSVALSSPFVLAGSTASPRAVLVDFSSTPPAVISFNPQLRGGCTAAIEGTIGVCGATTGGLVKLLDLTSSPPSVIGDINTQLDAISTAGISTFR
jgi:hypothetical protein